MSKEKKLSVKGRLTIHIKKTKPATLLVLLIAAAVLFTGLSVIGLTSKVKPVTAPAALTTSKVQFRMTLTGDITVDDHTRTQANKLGYAELLTGVSKYWNSSDCVIANLSGPVLQYDVDHYTSRKDALDEAVYLRPAALRGLIKAGITLPSFANEDVYNYGVTGINSTIRLLDEYQTEYLGISANSAQDYHKTFEYTFTGEDGTTQTRSVSVLSINDIIINGSTVRTNRAGVINSTMPSIFQTVYELSQTSDKVVVYVHFGEVNSSRITDEQRKLSHDLIDAGADLIVGTHSHTVQPVERYNDGLIVYGLGELLSTEDYSLSMDGALLDLVVRNSGEVVVYLTPTHMKEGRPVITKNWLYTKRIQNMLTCQLDDDAYRITEDGLVRISLGYLETK